MAASLQLPSLSTDYVLVPVEAVTPSGPVDPSGDVVEFAFKPIGTEPGGGDWITSSWAAGTVNGQYFAQCLIGPGSPTVLGTGVYVIWIRITDRPEIPVRTPGLLEIVP